MKHFLKITLLFLLCAMLLSGCGEKALSPQAQAVSRQLSALPSLRELEKLPLEEQQQIYLDTQSAYEGYLALSEAEREALSGGEKIFDDLFACFNTLVMPLEG